MQSSVTGIIGTKEYRDYRRELERGCRRRDRFSRLCAWLERLSRESFKNTRRYLRFFACIGLAYLIAFFATKDYYHGWYGVLCSFFDVSVFKDIRWEWALLWKIGKLILQLAALVGAGFSVYFIVKRCAAKYYQSMYFAQANGYMVNQHSVCCTGPPGAGKTSYGGDMSVHVAARRWEDLKYDYHTQKRQVMNWIRLGMTEELEKFRAIKDAYLFFKARERWYVPCLATTFGMRVGGRYTYKANNKFFTQMQRIPEYCVIFDDEAGSTKGANTSSNVADNVADFYRYIRHYGDFMIVMTEQGDDGAGKYIRKCLDNTIYCKGQKWVFRPDFLLRVFERMKRKMIDGEENGLCRLRYNAFVYYLGKIARTIGYRQITYKNMGNIEHEDGELKGTGGKIFLPARLIYDYDDRAYRFTYKAKDLPLDLEGWDRLTLLPKDDLRNVSVVRDDRQKSETKKPV